MAEMTILLRRNPDTGKQDIVVRIGQKAPPGEDEQMHRKLVERLISPDIKPEDMGELSVERGE